MRANTKRTCRTTYILEAVKHWVQVVQPAKGSTHLVRRNQESGKEQEYSAGETTVAEAYTCVNA
jgi:hypothetical protein